MPTVDSLIKPHGIFTDIINAIREEDTSSLEMVRNKISQAASGDPTSASLRVTLIQFIDNLDSVIRYSPENQELVEAQTKISELNLEIEEYEKSEAYREQRLEELKTQINDLIDNSLI
ncbi:MAG: hypothetical protein K0U41_06860 [Gammaproteobacteria bacterium]|nr:hypothetical protein [Gammaproteobacteria bacterium]